MQKEQETFYPKSREEWRLWLEENHIIKPSVWLVLFKKKSNIPTISHEEAIEEALCFGWIDSIRKSIDENSSIQFLSKRKPNSVWSKINKAKVKHLIEEGRMAKAGYESIEIAKQNGSWSILDTVEELIIPEDLETELRKYSASKDYFLSVSKSLRKRILQWIILAKKAETRQKRITEIAQHAAEKQVPVRFTN